MKLKNLGVSRRKLPALLSGNKIRRYCAKTRFQSTGFHASQENAGKPSKIIAKLLDDVEPFVPRDKNQRVDNATSRWHPYFNDSALGWMVIQTLDFAFKRICFRGWEIEGKENIEKNWDSSRPTVVCSNHSSEMEPFALGVALAKTTGIKPWFAVTSESWDRNVEPMAGLYKHAFRFFGGVPFDRSQTTLFHEDTKRMLSLLLAKEPWPLVMYPEAKVAGLIRFPTNRGELRSSVERISGCLPFSPLPVLSAAAVEGQIITVATSGFDQWWRPEKGPDRLYGEVPLLAKPKVRAPTKLLTRFGRVFDLKEIARERYGISSRQIDLRQAVEITQEILRPEIAGLIDGKRALLPYDALPLTDAYYLRARRLELEIAMQWWLKGQKGNVSKSSEALAFAGFAYNRKTPSYARDHLNWDHVLESGILQGLTKKNLETRYFDAVEQFHPDL